METTGAATDLATATAASAPPRGATRAAAALEARLRRGGTIVAVDRDVMVPRAAAFGGKASEERRLRALRAVGRVRRALAQVARGLKAVAHGPKVPAHGPKAARLVRGTNASSAARASSAAKDRRPSAARSVRRRYR